MNNNDKTIAGCLIVFILIVIVALIYWRAENAREFWVILGIATVGLFMLGLTQYHYANNNQAWGCLAGIGTFTIAFAVGYFLFTGNYGGTLQRIGLATPTPVVVTATPEDASTSVAPTATPLPETTIAEATAVAESTDDKDLNSNVGDQEKKVPWWQPDPQYRQTLTPQIYQWRMIAAVIIGVQYLLMLWVSQRIKRPNIGRNFVTTIISALLVFTVYGEWIYRIVTWLLNHGTVGKIAVFLLSALSGLTGVGNLTALLIGGFLYYDWDIFLWFLFPSIIVATIFVIVRLSQVRGVRVPDF